MKTCGTLTLDELVTLYTVDHLTCRQVASVAGVSHAYVHRCLKYCDVSSTQGEWVELKCFACGVTHKRTRSRIRCYRQRHFFCSEACFRAFLSNVRYVDDSAGRREARRLVSQYFELKPGYVVHHHDANETNNALKNLAVFAAQEDHMQYEWGGKVKPIWDGRFFRVPKGF